MQNRTVITSEIAQADFELALQDGQIVKCKRCGSVRVNRCSQTVELCDGFHNVTDFDCDNCGHTWE